MTPVFSDNMIEKAKYIYLILIQFVDHSKRDKGRMTLELKRGTFNQVGKEVKSMEKYLERYYLS